MTGIRNVVFGYCGVGFGFVWRLWDNLTRIPNVRNRYGSEEGFFYCKSILVNALCKTRESII